MGTIHDGGPAFPLAYVETNAHGVQFPFTVPGMSMRDWFAGQALTHFASFISVRNSGPTAKVIAGLSYEMADAMIAQRNEIASPAGETTQSAQDEAMEATVGEASHSIAERVRTLIAEMSGFEIESVTDAASWKDLNCDSLDRVELVMAIEQQFGIEVPDSDAETLLIVGDAIKYVEKATGGARG